MPKLPILPIVKTMAKIPKSLLRPPRGFKKPSVSDFKGDMEKLGATIAEEFKETVIENIETNEYGFLLAESTKIKKKSDVPLIDTHEMVDAIYRDKTTVSVKNTTRKSGITNLELALIQEYGTKDKHVPGFPVWRNTFADFKPIAKERIREFLKNPKFKSHGSKCKSI